MRRILHYVFCPLWVFYYRYLTFDVYVCGTGDFSKMVKRTTFKYEVDS